MSYMVSTTRLENHQCRPLSSYPSIFAQKLNGIQITVVKYIIPLFVLVYVYIKMALTLRNNQVTDETINPNSSGPSAPITAIRLKYRRSTIKTLAIVSGTFIGCWTANQVLFLLYNLGAGVDLSSPFYHFTVMLVFLNCCLNPLIYTLKYQPFQVAARNLFCRRSGADIQHHSSEAHTSTSA